VHGRAVHQMKERLLLFVRAVDEVESRGGEFLVARLHALLVNGRVLDPLPAHAAPARLLVGSSLSVAQEWIDAAGTMGQTELRVFRCPDSRLVFSVEMVEVAENSSNPWTVGR